MTEAKADVVEVVDGQRVDGVFKERTADRIVFEGAGQIVQFPRDKVRAIFLGSAALTTIGPPLRSEAVKGLRGLQSVTRGGVTYRDYLPRVSDAKIKVDDYLREPDRRDPELRKVIAEAMQLYVTASAVWSMVVTHRREKFRDNVREANEIEERLRVQFPTCKEVDRAWSLAVWGSASGLPILWACASERLAEVDRLLTVEK